MKETLGKYYVMFFFPFSSRGEELSFGQIGDTFDICFCFFERVYLSIVHRAQGVFQLIVMFVKK